MIELILPFCPSVNHYKTIGAIRTTRTGKLYQQRINSPETKRFYYEVWAYWQHKKFKEGLKSFDDATISLEVCIDQHPPDKRLRDIDNPVKLILDSLQTAGVIANDNQIARLIVQRCSMIQEGQIIVRIKPL